jgi:hypothetical protein
VVALAVYGVGYGEVGEEAFEVGGHGGSFVFVIK